SLMVGREIKNFYVKSEVPTTPGYLRVRNIRSPMYPDQSVSFDAAKGEILGFAGLVGAGRSEMAKTMVGLDGRTDAEIWLGDEKLTIHSPHDSIGHGIYLVPEDRRGEGLVVRMSIRENITLPSLPRFTRMGLIQRSLER